MSTQNRKISYWSLEFCSGDETYFDEDVFCGFLEYLEKLEPEKKLHRDEKQNKAFSIESIRSEEKGGKHLYKIVLKSCKYNHSPDYMSSIDGSERPTDKHIFEGDKELTHVCCRIDSNEAYTIIEDRRNGVAIGMFVKYLNLLLKDFIDITDGLDDNFNILASMVPSDDFLTALEKTTRISCAELFVEKKVVGSGYLELMDLDANAQEDVILSVKAKPRQTLASSIIEKTYNALTSGGTEITRVRIRGKDFNKTSVTIDSLNGKKTDAVTVELSENGIVDSYSFFSKIEELLGITI